MVAIVGQRTLAVLAWYKVAKENLSSAELLLKNKKVSHAIFFIQQCVECIVKGVFLESGVLNNDTTRQISHSPEDAYKLLYKQLDYSCGIYYCEEIPRQLNKGISFEEKLRISANIANQFTEDYERNLKNASCDANNIADMDPIALGLPPSATQLQCYLCFLITMYNMNMLLLFSCLFSHKVEQNAGYPQINAQKIVVPSDVFNTLTIEKGLQTIIPILTKILNDIIGLTIL
ncbi:HEPN domain-containing protein [Bacteroides faecalis]|uniref:HEPN domain-containing protein n=3 Tax=Bacteroides faecalis TaxID=2447885 RepID=A0A401LU96_9BACE|nr:HEPN domain-containing protein [Bacteroides faecalis]GCB35011.1 hypothetical protein KGMB02408_19560 [Bacteroides faecalis]